MIAVLCSTYQVAGTLPQITNGKGEHGKARSTRNMSRASTPGSSTRLCNACLRWVCSRRLNLDPGC